MEVGEKIDSYIITEVLSGGMSEVYKVFDGKDRYVLKCLKDNATVDDKKLFKREIRILKSLKHPNIIEIVSDTYDSEKPYYVMPNCGKSFVDVANSNTSELNLLGYVISFCEAIQFAHKNGVYHRDIKPQNVLLYKGVVKVSDFGLSRFVSRDTTTITNTDMKAGTQGYMPPEFYNGVFKNGTVEGDVYMIGKTIYYMFSHGKDVSNVRSEFVPLQIFSIIDKCTKNEPDQRYSSVGIIVTELKKYKNLLIEAENAPKTIDEIKASYNVNTPQFNKEVFKTLNTLGNNSTDWGDALQQLNNNDLIQVLTFNRDSIVSLSLYFINCLSSPGDFVQFSDIDEFARFTKILVNINTDETIKQNLIALMIKMSISYCRYPAMKIVAHILNEQIEKDYSRYKVFVMLQCTHLRNICEQLGGNYVFNDKIKALLKAK